MAQRKTAATMEREAYLVRELVAGEKLIAESKKRGHATLLSKLLVRQDTLQAELTELRKAAAEEARREALRRPEDMSDEEWRARVAEDAAAATEDDLDVYMREWARRRRYVVVVEAGEVALRRRAVG